MLYFVLVVLGIFLSVQAVDIDGDVAIVLIGAFMGWLTAYTCRLSGRVKLQDQQLKTLIAKTRATATKKPVSDAGDEIKAGACTTREDISVAEEAGFSFSQSATPQSQPAVTAKGAGGSQPEQHPQAPPSRPAQVKPTSVPSPAWVSEPGWIAKKLALVWQWVVTYFTGGNLMVRVGVLILFFGVAFLLKYAAHKVVVPIELRYLGIMAGATGLLMVGWWLRKKNEQFALVVQGGAVGVLYLVVFTAFRLHGILSPTVAFALLLGVVVLTAVIAILQNSVWLAAVGVTGGFLAPILASSGSGSHVELFSYYLLLNVGIAVIAFYRSWRFLNWLGFLFTFGVGAIWGTQYYHAQFFGSVEPFLVSFFLLYTLIPLLYSIKQPPEIKGVVDGSLIFGTPVAFMALQSQLVDGYASIPHLIAWTSAAMGTLYIVLALLVRRRSGLALLCESYIVMAIAFLTLAVPLGFDGRVTSAIWAIEGAALIWIGLRQYRLLPRLTGMGLIVAAGIFYFREPVATYPTLFILNADFVGAALIACAALYAARLYHHPDEQRTVPEKGFAPFLLLIWGYCWWFGGGLHEIDHHFTALPALALFEMFVALTGAACWFATHRTRMRLTVIFGLLTVLTGGYLLLDNFSFDPSSRMWLNLNVGSAAMFGLLCLWMAVFSWKHHFPEHFKPARIAQWLLLWAATLVMMIFGFAEIAHFLASDYRASFFLLYAVVILLPLVALHRRVPWSALAQPILLILPLLTLTFMVFVVNDWHLASYYGWVIFPFTVICLYFTLKYLEPLSNYPLGYFHLAAILIFTCVLAWQFGKLFRPSRTGETSLWLISVWGMTFSLVLVALRKVRTWAWPFGRYCFELNRLLPRILLCMSAVWVVVSNLRQPGTMAPIPYLPIVNPLDIVNLIMILLIFLWLKSYDRDFFKGHPALVYVVTGMLGFLCINASLLRGFHFLYGIPFRFAPMVGSFAVECGVSILWSVLGLVTMVTATRRGCQSRPLWIVGASLMAVVVMKLFTVDMSHSGSIARIVAFITVGCLLLVVGYFAPVPPRSNKTLCNESVS